MNADKFIESFEEMAEAVHANAVAHGWWDQERNDGEMIAKAILAKHQVNVNRPYKHGGKKF